MSGKSSARLSKAMLFAELPNPAFLPAIVRGRLTQRFAHAHVRYWCKFGKHMLSWRFSAFDLGRVKTFFLRQTVRKRARSTSTRPFEFIFAVSSLESIRAQPKSS